MKKVKAIAFCLALLLVFYAVALYDFCILRTGI